MMKKIMTYTFSFIAIVLFLASSTGISFVIHHCSANHTEEIRFFTSDYQCSHEENLTYCADVKVNHEQHQCTINKNHHCCKNIRGYFKINDEYTPNKNITKVNPSILYIEVPLNISNSLIQYSSAFHSSKIPLTIHTDQDILSLYSQFRI